MKKLDPGRASLAWAQNRQVRERRERGSQTTGGQWGREPNGAGVPGPAAEVGASMLVLAAQFGQGWYSRAVLSNCCM